MMIDEVMILYLCMKTTCVEGQFALRKSSAKPSARQSLPLQCEAVFSKSLHSALYTPL